MKEPHEWVTRRRAKVDRIACRWLIKKFMYPAAEFIFVPTEMVKRSLRKRGHPFRFPRSARGSGETEMNVEENLRVNDACVDVLNEWDWDRVAKLHAATVADWRE